VINNRKRIKNISPMKNLTLLLLPCALLSFAACDDEKEGCMDPISINYDPEADKDDGSCEYAGTGGSTELVFFPKLDTIDIVSSVSYQDTAYLKFNAIGSPGMNPSDYDLVYPGDVHEDHIHFYNMKKGKYYIYMTGWCDAINKRVSGGMAVTVTNSSGVVNFIVPVSY
jgi:hypothetical protein